jgi:protein-S-isoprenylcysteine O-methyltransferase Ste14
MRLSAPILIPLLLLIGVNLLSFALFLAGRSAMKRRGCCDWAPRGWQLALLLLNTTSLALLPLVSPQPRTVAFPALVMQSSGLLLCMSAVVIWFLAFFHLRSESRLVSRGIYAITRHPIYLGSILLGFGLAFLFRSSFAILYAPVAAVLYGWLALTEEKDLLEVYDEAFDAYQRKTVYRLLPFIF